MEQERIRLGGVEAVYEADQGLVLRDVHQSETEIRIYESDIPELIQFLSRHDLARRLALRIDNV